MNDKNLANRQKVINILTTNKSVRRSITPTINKMVSGPAILRRSISSFRSKPNNIIPSGEPQEYEIFAYCSKNYEDAYNFVIDSWIKCKYVTKIYIYTDWDLKSINDKVEIRHMFEPSNDWIVGTGRRLDVIKHYSDENQGKKKNVLFMDIDCYIVKEVGEVFNLSFDIGITRLYSQESYAKTTATAGLWFAKLTPGYYKFINDWFARAEVLKDEKKGLLAHHISYVQYSFTDIARAKTDDYKVQSLDEKIYNSEHTLLDKWYRMISQYKPSILHYKGRRFRDQEIVEKSLSLAGV